jgi:hypothetical protein
MSECVKCNKSFKSIYNLNKHNNKKIPCDLIIKCENCLKIFNTKQNLNKHNNRKNPCIKVDLIKENEKLKEENERLKKTSNITNIQNNTIINNTINIFTPEGKLYHSYFIKSKPLEQLEFNIDELSNLTIEDYTDELSNIYNFTNLLKELCFNIDVPDNWIICKDDLFNKLKLKIDNDIVVNCVDNMLHLIYSIAKQVVNYNELDKELIEFYNTFINKYERNEYKDDDNVRQFIKLCNDELFKHFSKIINTINDRKNNIRIIEPEMVLNNFEDEDIIFIKKNILNIDILNILDKDYSREFHMKSFKVDEYKYTGIIDIKMIDIFTYFLKLIYKNPLQLCNQTIKYELEEFYIYKNKEWCKISINELINKIFSKIHIILKIYKINLPENMHSEDYIELLYKEKYSEYCKIGDSKYYKKIIKQYYKNDKSFINHESNIIN